MPHLTTDYLLEGIWIGCHEAILCWPYHRFSLPSEDGVKCSIAFFPLIILKRNWKTDINMVAVFLSFSPSYTPPPSAICHFLYTESGAECWAFPLSQRAEVTGTDFHLNHYLSPPCRLLRPGRKIPVPPHSTTVRGPGGSRPALGGSKGSWGGGGSGGRVCFELH